LQLALPPGAFTKIDAYAAVFLKKKLRNFLFYFPLKTRMGLKDDITTNARVRS
jgi:hypothetical protein